jgi:hypothetical protein
MGLIMKCSHPQRKTKTFKGTTTQYEHACGQCIECRVTKTGYWVLRMLLEYAANPIGAVFVTLTYAPENLPLSPQGFQTLEPDAIKAFMKRLRKNTSLEHLSLRFFGTAEYGEKSGRPHYHFILFGMDILTYRPQSPIKFTLAQNALIRSRGIDPAIFTEIEREILRAWQFKGNIKVDDFNANRAAYIIKYVLKNQITDNLDNSDRLPEYHGMSRMPGLGLPGVKRIAAQLINLKVFPEDLPYLKMTDEWKPIPFNLMQKQSGAKHSANYSVTGGRQKGSRGIRNYPIDPYLRKYIIKSMEQQLNISDNRSEKTMDIINDMKTRSELVLYRTGNVIALDLLATEDLDRKNSILKLRNRWKKSGTI